MYGAIGAQDYSLQEMCTEENTIVQYSPPPSASIDFNDPQHRSGPGKGHVTLGPLTSCLLAGVASSNLDLAPRSAIDYVVSRN
jgi:hypothetical protein